MFQNVTLNVLEIGNDLYYFSFLLENILHVRQSEEKFLKTLELWEAVIFQLKFCCGHKKNDSHVKYIYHFYQLNASIIKDAVVDYYLNQRIWLLHLHWIKNNS